LRTGDDGRAQGIEGRYGLRRPDVAAVHGETMAAEHCGFVVSGRVSDLNVKKIFLEVEFTDGGTSRIDCRRTTVPGRRSNRSGLPSRLRRRRLWLRIHLGYLARRGLKALSSKDKRMRGSSAALRSVARLDLDRFLSSLPPSRPRGLAVMIDHNLGGGTNLYREHWIRQRRLAGEPVILLYYDFKTLAYYLRYLDEGHDEILSVDSLETVVILTAALTPKAIFVNHTYSWFDDSLVLAEALPYLKHVTGAQLSMATHDYFTICPSLRLLDDGGRFCGVPAIARCRECLPNIRTEIRSLVGCHDIDRWRTLWGRCLDEATTVLCFSRTSIDLLRRAYPYLAPDKFVLQPHTVDYLPEVPMRLPLDEPLNIGVVGIISEAKGAGIVREMARLIHHRRSSARITVIGAIDDAVESEILRITGPYQRLELPELIARSRANVFFVPSVWPETFSYVTAELIQMGLPLVVFRLGAQAEHVASYPHGLIIETVSAEHALDGLAAFRARLRRDYGAIFTTRPRRLDPAP
jgi:glycosyltransferase involved in cell wall biosynthesis